MFSLFTSGWEAQTNQAILVVLCCWFYLIKGLEKIAISLVRKKKGLQTWIRFPLVEVLDQVLNPVISDKAGISRPHSGQRPGILFLVPNKILDCR